MSPEHGQIYIMQDTDEEWVAPTPARAAITDALATATDLDEADIKEIDIDRNRLRELLDGEDGEQTFTIEGYDVTIDSSGDITVSE
ncbi:HalOD1 output domain-containing protein [Halovenus sp. HT40]|uniref:HalOD1 output domain-containing protein n=1 Tax=Halovenus sp. HT40 TaxID=3126691 RepID=UPI00300E9176